jgi:hypothetical protein
VSLYATEDFIDVLGIKETTLAAIQHDLPAQTVDMKYTLLANTNVASWSCVRDRMLDRLGMEFRPLHMSMQPNIDATRIFCDRLRSGDPQVKPNIAIIHIRRGQERVPVTTRFLQAEAASHAENLPLIILSPKGDIALEEREMAKRQYKLLPIPVHIPRLLDACKILLT